jgi:hypothetical protein
MDENTTGYTAVGCFIVIIFIVVAVFFCSIGYFLVTNFQYNLSNVDYCRENFADTVISEVPVKCYPIFNIQAPVR